MGEGDFKRMFAMMNEEERETIMENVRSELKASVLNLDVACADDNTHISMCCPGACVPVVAPLKITTATGAYSCALVVVPPKIATPSGRCSPTAHVDPNSFR